MTNQQPSYLRQSVSYLGFLSQQLGDLTGKTVLAHELIQNADDAKDEAGNLAATRITFDITDEALIVSNDAVFREEDFERMRNVASGSKRAEFGQSTTGMFGVGFISVYQITDRPEILSAGRKWVLRPECPEERRIEQWENLTTEGTVFRLPWAFEESEVRISLKTSPIDVQYQDSLVDELSEALPRAILFLKKLERIELCQNGKPVSVVTRRMCDNMLLIEHNGSVMKWNILEANFPGEAMNLKSRYSDSIDQGRSDRVRVAIPGTLIEDGLLFATLPTEQATGLPFHVDADFFPSTDRKTIAFGDSHDPRSEWNRAAIRAAASAVHSNLIPLRDMCCDNAATFWDFLGRVAGTGSDERRPFGEFWKGLLPVLAEAPVVYTESGEWLVPKCTRIPRGLREQDAVCAFLDLGIEIAHHTLWTHQNLLTSRDVGVRTLSASDIYHRLKVKGYTDKPIASPPVDSDLLDLLWRGIAGILTNTQGRASETAKSLLATCSLAPGLDGCIWPCHSAYQADNEQTRDLFAPLMPMDKTFLARFDVSLLEQLCPKFSEADAIATLASLDKNQHKRSGGEYDSEAILQWFEEHKLELTKDLRAQLIALPIFPSTKGLHPLEELWLSGGFEDPIGAVDILDSKLPDSLSSFLRELGVKRLGFKDYVMRYVTKAFKNVSETETKRKLLATLEKHIGEIKDDDQVRDTLSKTWLVECEDGSFRQPHATYFRDKGVYEVLDNHANYALVPNNTVLRRDLYEWLGVQSRPRISDMRKIVNKVTKIKPTDKAKSIVAKMIKNLGLRWKDLDDSEKHACRNLRSEAWLPAEGDGNAWYQPNELFATFNKSLFATQGKFLDVPIQIQRNISEFLGWMDVNLSPKPFLVVRHLLHCSVNSQKPPNGIYEWLNTNSNASALRELTDAACLWVADGYLRPNQVFWGSHPFGRHRVQLDSELRSLQHLLKQLGVRETPDFNDAIDVLKDLSEDVGSTVLEADDKNVVMQCWLMLSDALQEERLKPNVLNKTLRDVQCVPTEKDFLQLPSRMFFEDRSGLADKFPGPLSQNCISRTERAWVAMEAAGVNPVSKVIRGYVADCVNSRKVEAVSERVKARIDLIGTILEAADVPVQEKDILNSIGFIQVDTLTVRWTLKAFGQKWVTPPEPSSAYWDREKQVVFFVNHDDGIPPWSAIARELTLVLAPGKNLASISPGLNTVLEAGTTNNAEEQLSDLGIASIHIPDRELVEGAVADSLGGNASGIDDHGQVWIDHPNTPDNDHLFRGAGSPAGGFARKFHGVWVPTPSPARDNPVVLPPAGPNTSRTARDHMIRASNVGRSEAYELKLVEKLERGPMGRALEDEFRSMVHGDYGKRCQICGRTFAKPSGGWQVNVVHVVPPMKDTLANHFGDLLGLCGWHFNLLQYGQGTLFDPNTDQPFEDVDGTPGWEHMREFILNRTRDVDSWGNEYVGLPIRFANVYRKWKSEPEPIDEEIRYSIPHWEYLCELLKA